jgi:hypothetical protein
MKNLENYTEVLVQIKAFLAISLFRQFCSDRTLSLKSNGAKEVRRFFKLSQCSSCI